MPRQHPEPLPQWPYQEPFNIYNVAQQNIGNGLVPNGYPVPQEQLRRRENREFTPDLWNEVQTLILELSDLKKKLIEKGVI